MAGVPRVMASPPVMTRGVDCRKIERAVLVYVKTVKTMCFFRSKQTAINTVM